MKINPKNLLGLILIVIGLLVIAFSYKIVFPGCERLFGIETIVGKENVVYEPDGSYGFTNPSAMAKWVASVAGTGVLICSIGVWLSGLRLRFRRRTLPAPGPTKP